MAKRIKPQTSIEYRTDYVTVFCHGIVVVLNKKSFHQAPVSGLEPGIYIKSNRCNHRSTGHLKLFRTSFHGDESLGCHTLMLYTRGPWFKSQSGNSTLGQSTLSSLPSLLEETLWCESHPVCLKVLTSLLAKEQGEILVKWSDRQTNRRVTVMSLILLHPGIPWDCQSTYKDINDNDDDNNNYNNCFLS